MIKSGSRRFYLLLKRAGQSALSDSIDKPPVRYSSVIVSPEADANRITKFLCVTKSEMIVLSARKSEPFFAISAVHVLRAPLRRCRSAQDRRHEQGLLAIRPSFCAYGDHHANVGRQLHVGIEVVPVLRCEQDELPSLLSLALDLGQAAISTASTSMH